MPTNPLTGRFFKNASTVADCEENDGPVFEFFRQFVEMCDRANAGTAPSGPHLQHNHLPGQRFETGVGGRLLR
jgi:hypothetical protein